jgi:hypothetical protein
MSFISNHVIHIKSCHSCQIMSFMSNYIIYVIYVKSCQSCQIMSFMSNHVIHVKSCHSCQIMSFMSNHGIHVKSCQPFVILAFSGQTFTKVGREGRVKYVFLGLRRQLRCLAEGKKNNVFPPFCARVKNIRFFTCATTLHPHSFFIEQIVIALCRHLFPLFHRLLLLLQAKGQTINLPWINYLYGRKRGSKSPSDTKRSCSNFPLL